MIKQEVEYFFAALRFFTRMPVPAWVGHSAEQLNHAARYFPLIGVIVGATGATATYFVSLILPTSLAILLGMLTTLLVTGAFHEDGLADAVDGFGGDWEKSRILEIMKDSRIGSYGAITITMMLLAKLTALQEIASARNIIFLCTALVSAHAISRFASTTLIYFLEYVREDALSKSKPLAQKLSRSELLVAFIFGALPCIAIYIPFQCIGSLLLAIALVVLVTYVAGRYFQKHIGGYTGDCLGATQQLSELAFYLGLLCKFS